jgi:hypothetical protein
MLRGLGVAAALVVGGAQAAMAQPSANAVAAVETALFCGEVMKRATDMANFNLYKPGDRRAYDKDLEEIATRYVTPLDNWVKLAGYTPEKLAERRAAHRADIGKMVTNALTAQTSLCGNKVNLMPTDATTPPSVPMALALGGRTKTDVMFVDMGSLNRLGNAVSGWQLYVFKADQNVGGKPSKGQWTRFIVDCMNPTFVNYGMIGLSNMDTGQPYTADTRKTADIKPLQAGTFGAAAWMLACGVTAPGATQASLTKAAEFSATQFVQ